MSNALKIAGALGAAAGGAPTDPNFSSVSLLLHGDGTNGAQNNTFLDGSSNNFTITRNGNTTQGSFSPFSGTGGSGYFDGTGDYLTVPDNAALEFGSGDFCIEGWFNRTNLSSAVNLINKRPNSSTNAAWAIYCPANLGTVYFYASSNGSSFDIINGVTLFGTFVANEWAHIAVYRVGNAWYGSFNGVVTTLLANTSATIADTSATVNIGGDTNGNYLTGYASNIRLVKGSSVYTSSNFTPPTSPLTAITNTSLLLNFTNAGITDSARKANLETVGNAQVSTSVVKYGTGSMAFDGTGDWLTSPDNPNLQLGSGAFTIECWLYLSATGAARGIVGKGTATTGWLLSVNASNQVVFTDTTTAITSTGTLAGTTWYHITVVREGTGSNQTKIYIGGVNDGTGTSATNFNQTSIMYIGANRTGGDALNGYIDDLRITKGVARYTANFTPPTAAFPDS